MNSSNPSSKKNGPEVKDSALEAEGPGNVDKIRDILFGTQMRDYDGRFSRFEERLLKETSDLREDTKRRIATLEGFVKAETQALADQIKAEQGERLEAEVTDWLRAL